MQNRRNRYCWLIGLLSSALWAGCVVEDVADDGPLADKVAQSRAPLLGAESSDVISGQYIVMFREDTPAASIAAARNRVALADDASRVMQTYSVIPGFSARLSPAALEALRRNPEVSYVEADRTVTARAIHPAPSEGNDRTDQCTGADGLYDDQGLTGSNTHVYVIDTGIRSTHDEFTGRVIRGMTAINDGRGIEDCNGHGTHVASLAVGTEYGMAKQAIVHPVRVLDCIGSGSFSGVIAGVDFVRNDCPNQSGPCVANMSLGGSASTSLETAVKNLVASGVTVVAAAGTDACNSSPGNIPEVITVAKTCSTSPCVDILAPGISILGADIGSDSDSQTLSGDSMSAALVSGAVAMHLGANPSATPADVDAAMKSTAVTECGCAKKRLYNDFSTPISCPACDDSCAGRCGDYDPNKSCQCDTACSSFGDCCADKEAICG